MKTFAEMISDLPAERKEAILARAEELIREERSGRSAPESNRNAAVMIAGCVALGVVLGIALLIVVIVT